MVFEEQGEEEENKVASVFPTKPSPQTDVREHLCKAMEKQLHFNCFKKRLFIYLAASDLSRSTWALGS